MRSFSATAMLVFVPLLAAISSHAMEPTAYTNPGVVAPSQILTAAVTGSLDGYFVSSFAGGDDSIRLYDVTAGTYSPWLLDNRTSVSGDSVSFGHVTAGDLLVFELRNMDLADPNGYFAAHDGIPLGAPLASDAAYSPDGIGHAFVEAYQGGLIGGVPFPAGTFVGMEDLPLAVGDLDYNDVNFLFTNVASTPSPVPEPSTLALLGTGLIGLSGAIRRRLAR